MVTLTSLRCIVKGIAAAFFTATVSYAGVFQSFEAENLDISSYGADYEVTWNEAGASNNAYVHFQNPGPTTTGAWLRFGFTNSEEGSYNVTVYYKARDNRAKCLTRIAGDYVGTEMDQYNQDAVHQVAFSVGMVSLTAGYHYMSFTVNGKNDNNNTGYYMLTIDKIEFDPVSFPDLWFKSDDIVQLVTPADRVAVGTPTSGSTAALEVSSGNIQVSSDGEAPSTVIDRSRIELNGQLSETAILTDDELTFSRVTGEQTSVSPTGISVANNSAQTQISPSSITTGTIYVGTDGWSITAPDFVFKKDYELMPLKDVEKFVDTHKHLPDMPSAESMEESGSVNLVEMNLKLLKKIEELTLHSIEQEKRTIEQEKRIIALEKVANEK